MNQFTDILKKQREALDLNKTKMAKRLGISSQLYGQYESGTTGAGVEFYKKWNEKFPENRLSIDESIVSRGEQSISADYDLYNRLIEVEAKSLVFESTLVELLCAVQKKSSGVVSSELKLAVSNMRELIKNEYKKS